MSRKLLPLIVVPGLWIQSGVFSRPHGIVPCPACQFALIRMAGHQDLRDPLSITLRLLVHRELIYINGFILVHACLDVPTCEVTAVRARERARTHATHRRALPIAVINVGAIFRYAGVLERKSD